MIEAPEDYAERAEGRVSVTGNERDCEHISPSWDVVLNHMEHGVHIGSYESKERAEEVAFVIQHEIGRVLSDLASVTEELNAAKIVSSVVGKDLRRTRDDISRLRKERDRLRVFAERLRDFECSCSDCDIVPCLSCSAKEALNP